MKKWKKSSLCLIFACFTALALAGCNKDDANMDSSSGKQAEQQEQQEQQQPLDLTGEWKQVNGNSEDSYQAATIQGDTIEVYWIFESDDTKSLYWAGSYIAPTTAEDTYSWDSANDTEKTDMALMASGDATKTFSYENGQISYDVTAMGMTQTVKLEKQ